MKCKIDHIVINAFDVDKMVEFYSGVLQLQTERLEEFNDQKVPFPSLRLNKDAIIDLFPKPLWEKTSPPDVCRPNLNHFCLCLGKDSWEDLRKRLIQFNVQVDDGPVRRWGAHGSGVSIYFRDPEQNVIEARYYDQDNADKPCMLGS